MSSLVVLALLPDKQSLLKEPLSNLQIDEAWKPIAKAFCFYHLLTIAMAMITSLLERKRFFLRRESEK
jgi:hypothetical protein